MESVLSNGNLTEDMVNFDRIAMTALDGFLGSLDTLAVAILDDLLSQLIHFRGAHSIGSGRHARGMSIVLLVDRALIAMSHLSSVSVELNEQDHVVGDWVTHDVVLVIHDSEHEDGVAFSSFSVQVPLDIEVLEADVDVKDASLSRRQVVDILLENHGV